SPEATSIQWFQRSTRPVWSRTTTPPSMASRTASAFIPSTGMGRSRILAQAGDVLGEQGLQCHQGGQVEQHGQVALQVAVAHREVDVDEQHDVIRARVAGETEELRTIAVGSEERRGGKR